MQNSTRSIKNKKNERKKMFSINQVKPGQRVSLIYNGPIDWARVTGNPLRLKDVRKAYILSFSAAGAETYENAMENRGGTMSGKPTWHIPAPEVGPCVRKHKSDDSRLYLAGINHIFNQIQFTIDGQKATEKELEIIRQFTERKESNSEVDFRLWSVEKLQNAIVE